MTYFYMVQESIYKNIAIIGCGAAGGLAAVLLCKNPYNKVTAFDVKEPFSTLLPTGGGRCNLTNDEKDVREFVKNYPRGEKFLISVFSKFGQEKTRELFKDLGIKTYVQEDKRVFPISNSSQKTIQTLNKHLETSNFKHIKEKVVSIKKEDKFVVKSENKEYVFDYVIVTTGGRGNGFEIAKNLGHNIIEPKPSLCAIDIEEKYLYSLSGLSFKNVEIQSKLGKKKLPTVYGDILFSHKAITGPAIFKVSALSAFDNIEELEMTIKLVDISQDEIEKYIRENQKKTIKNVFSKFVPESYINAIIDEHKIDGNKQTAQIKKQEKEILINSLLAQRLHAKSRLKDSEIVTAGGIDLKEIDSKTMQSKLVDGLYFAGEILNIDAYTGGFNLQNCWSTAFIIAQDLN
ncbi:aminoacetone oxidase family FAD-binding enzyme [bacterium]|nr:aminoacetone oxidase family FAD-binding enzyme [bacterium]